MDTPVRFQSYNAGFQALVGNSASSKVLLDSPDGEALYHEACIYHATTKSVLVTSNQLPHPKGADSEATGGKAVKLLRIYDTDESEAPRVEQIVFPNIEGAMLNGGVNASKPDSILLCAQGSHDSKHPNGIIELQLPSVGEAARAIPPSVVVSNFYGVPFNSVNDVIVHPVDNSIWFTDPCYGHHQGIRPAPSLPNQVYRHNPSTGLTRVMAAGFMRPNGLCFSPDLTVLYVTDTGAIHGSPDVPFDNAGPSHIYAFDIVDAGKNVAWVGVNPKPFLMNRRLFAFAPGRIPDGIKCDMEGNVYAGCGDGIEVWDRYGEPLGVFQIKGGIANFCFSEPGVIYACNETRFIKIRISNRVEGALLGSRLRPRRTY
jgi:gluconolactonase